LATSVTVFVAFSKSSRLTRRRSNDKGYKPSDGDSRESLPWLFETYPELHLVLITVCEPEVTICKPRPNGD
jgi:hypothetical protein